MTRSFIGTVVLVLATSVRTAAQDPTAPQDPPSPQTIYERIMSAPPVCAEASPCNRPAVRLVAAGRSVLPHLVDLAKSGRAESSVVWAIGFVATEQDEEAVTALCSVAFGPSSPTRADALDALLRIGGTCVDVVLERLDRAELDHDQVEVVVNRIWALRDLGDLQRALTALERIARLHPEAGVRNLVSEQGLTRIRLVLEIRRSPRAPRSHESLIRILNRRQTGFTTLPGPTGPQWALARMVENRTPGTEAAIREYLQSAPTSLNGSIRAGCLLAIQAVGGTLSADEAEYLLRNPQFDEINALPEVTGTSLQESTKQWDQRHGHRH